MNLKYLNEIPSDIYSDLKQIDSGTFSCIFSATHIKTNVKVALKISIKSGDTEKMEIIKGEALIHKMLNHPLICRYFTEYETEHLFIIAMELIEGTNLLEYVNQRNDISIKQAQNIFAQLVIVIEYLHLEHGISHRDLKLENIMIDNYGHIRLIDFGFSTSKNLMSTICGSVPYCAPELLVCQNYTKKSDIWCLGVILYALVADQLPFYHTNMVKLIDIINKNEPEYPDYFDPCLTDLLSKLLMKDQDKRISLEDVKKHSFISHVSLFRINYKRLFSSNICLDHPRKRTKSHIKASKSNPNLIISPNLESGSRRRFLSLDSTSSSDILNSNSISKLHNIITLSTEKVDDLIISRKDYPNDLNKLIEAALLDKSSYTFTVHVSHIKLRSTLPLRFHIVKKNPVCVPQSPLIATPT